MMCFKVFSRLFTKQGLSTLFGLFAVTLGVLFGSGGQARAESLLVGIALPSYRESRWVYDLQSFQNVADARNIDFLVRFAGNDQEYQNVQIVEMLNQGIDVLIVAPNDSAAASAGVFEANKRGVPVIAYDRLVTGCELDAFVAFDQYKVGELLGEFLAGHKPEGNYILISGPPNDANSAVFTTGSMHFMRPLIDSGKITVVASGVATQWRADVAKKIVENYLLTGGGLDAVLAPNDDTAGGVIEALIVAKLQGKVLVTGQDANMAALERIKEGTQSMSVFKDTSLLAEKAMDVAVELVHGNRPATSDSTDNNGDYPVPTYKVPVTYVDQANVDWVLKRQHQIEQ